MKTKKVSPSPSPPHLPPLDHHDRKFNHRHRHRQLNDGLVNDDLAERPSLQRASTTTNMMMMMSNDQELLSSSISRHPRQKPLSRRSRSVQIHPRHQQHRPQQQAMVNKKTTTKKPKQEQLPKHQQQRQNHRFERRPTSIYTERGNTNNDNRHAHFHDRYDSRIIRDVDGIGQSNDDCGRLEETRVHRSPSDFRRGRTDALKSSSHHRPSSSNSSNSIGTPASIILPTGDVRDLSFYRDDHKNDDDGYINSTGHGHYEAISNDWPRQIGFHGVPYDRSTALFSPYRQDDGIRSIQHTRSFQKQQKQNEYGKLTTPRTSSISTGSSSSSSSSSSDGSIDGDRFRFLRGDEGYEKQADSRPKLSRKTSLAGRKNLSRSKSTRSFGASNSSSGNRRTLQRSISYHPRMQVHPSGPRNGPRRTQSTIMETPGKAAAGAAVGGGTNGAVRPFLPKRSRSIHRSFYEHKEVPDNDTDIWVERLVLGGKDGPKTCFKSVRSNKTRQEPPTGAKTIIYLSDMIERKKGQGKRQQQQLRRSPSYKNQRSGEPSRPTRCRSTKVQIVSQEPTPPKTPSVPAATKKKKKKKKKRKNKNIADTSTDVGAAEGTGAVPTAKTKRIVTAGKTKTNRNKSNKEKKRREEVEPPDTGPTEPLTSSRRGRFFGFLKRSRR